MFYIINLCNYEGFLRNEFFLFYKFRHMEPYDVSVKYKLDNSFIPIPKIIKRCLLFLAASLLQVSFLVHM